MMENKLVRVKYLHGIKRIPLCLTLSFVGSLHLQIQNVADVLDLTLQLIHVLCKTDVQLHGVQILADLSQSRRHVDGF